MNINPYDSAVGNLEPRPNPPRAQWVLILKRFFTWCAGFVVLFSINLLVELVVFPHWGLENTQDNDVYFMSWWIVVGLWFVFGYVILVAPDSRRTVDTVEQDQNSSQLIH